MGDPSAGDSRIPGIGNGGYDAQHYDASLQVQEDGYLKASSVMTAQATQDLDQFNLDFVGFDIGSVKVNGTEANHRREDGELIIEPKDRISKDQTFAVEVEYEGKPEPFPSKYAPVPLGWNTFEGGSFVVSEPDGTRAWIPVNDHPTDKATYDFRITVPKPLVAAANGVLQSVEESEETRTYHFRAMDQMASYLATVHVGRYELSEQEGPDGVPIRNYFPEDIKTAAEHDFARVPEMMKLFGDKFGPYPFEVYGNIVMDTNLGGAAALETQTLSLYDRGMVTGDRRFENVVAHELAHHWFGNSVSPSDWKDIWLNEGLASYAEVLWTEHTQGYDAMQRSLRQAEAIVKRHGSSAPIAEPPATGLFDAKVYKGGTLAVHALRREVGDDAFFEILKAYHERHRDGTASTEDLVAVSSEVAGRDLNEFFDRWVRSEVLPPVPA